MKVSKFKISGEVQLYRGEAAWHFIRINKKDAEDIKREYMWPRRGFGAIPVSLTIGATIWKTSVFPEKGGTSFLPLKKEVRVKENIKEGDRIKIILEVMN